MSQKQIKLFYSKTDDGMGLLDTYKDAYKQFVEQALNGMYVAEIKRYYPGKTHQQVKAIFGLMIEQTIIQANDLGIDVSYFLKYLLDAGIPKGQGLTKDFLHELMYVVCPTIDDDGKRVTLSKMNTAQAAALFERFRNTVSGLGIVIPDPSDPSGGE